MDLARSLASWVTELDAGRWPRLAEGDRPWFRHRCADRAVELLTQAVQHGAGDGDPVRLDSAELRVLSDHPDYRRLVAALKQPRETTGAPIRSLE
jgi:hypothetical protein